MCKMRVDSGEYRKVKRMSRAHVSAADEDDGIALLCCIQPRSGMVVSQAIGEGEGEDEDEAGCGGKGRSIEKEWAERMMQLTGKKG